MAKLGINIDHVATLRQARGNVFYPDPISAAAIVEEAGADQVTIHLREDRRHIQDADLFTLRKTVKTLLNLELAATDEIVGIASKVRPNTCTFVPERRMELTTEGGLDIAKNFDKLRGYTQTLKDNSIIVSMFIDLDLEQVLASKEVGATAIELHTGRYCELYNCSGRACSARISKATPRLGSGQGFAATDVREELSRLKKAAIRAREIGLYVAAGHGLNYDNITFVVKEIPEIMEYNIGHAVIARAVFVGLAQAVAEMKEIIK